MTKKKHIPNWMKVAVQERDGNQCRYCGDTVEQFHIDHVYPESEGGETVVENLVMACATCNHKKHAKIGTWPKPIGYFDDNPRKIMISLALSLSNVTMGFVFAAWLFLVFAISYSGWLSSEQVYIAVGCAAAMTLVGFGVFIASKFAWRSVRHHDLWETGKLRKNGDGWEVITK